jgi:hypothetical protein
MRGDRNPKASTFWLTSSDLSFADIVNKSNCKRLYVEYQYVLSNNKVNNSVLKPINDYVYNLYPAPDLLKYEDGFVYLRQKTHAEIWIKKNYNEGFYFLDRPHIRQFYPSSEILKDSQCFLPTFKFYCPWFVDMDRKYQVLQVTDVETPFLIKELKLNKIDTNKDILEPHFISFLFKKVGEHMINKDYGKISIGTPMYDIKIKVNESEYDLFNKFYSQHSNSK